LRVRESSRKMEEYLAKKKPDYSCSLIRFLCFLRASSIRFKYHVWVFWSVKYFAKVCIFLLLILFRFSFAYLLFFCKAFAAKTVSILFWFVTVINFYNSFPTGLKYVFAILPNTALNFAFQIIFQYERNGSNCFNRVHFVLSIEFISFLCKIGKYLDFSKLYQSLYEGDMNLGTLLVVMLVWSAFYLILSWYIERINPGDYGVKLPLYFPFMVTWI